MPFTVFYSWQSDLPNKVNRNFIEDALEKAIKKIGADIEVQEALRDEDIEIDKDTKGVPGSPPIVDVIFNKISNCSIFVPDLTFVGQSENGRQLPNPNVLIEYGWALKELSHSRIIPLMNTAFGQPTTETMPFDMRHLRFPITYHLPEGVEPNTKKTEKEKFVNALVDAISLVIKNVQLIEDKSGPTIEPVQSTDTPATFLKNNEVFARLSNFEGAPTELVVPAGEKIFLRLIPSTGDDTFKSTKLALDAAKKGMLAPLSETAGGTFGRNKYGAFVCNHREGEVVNMTQLFKSGEIWGIDAHCINKSIHMDRAKVKFGFFPCVSFENCFVTGMTNYMRFAQETLSLDPPIKFVAGASDVIGFRMTAPAGMHFGGFERFAGDVVEQHIVYEGEIDSYDIPILEILRPFFDHVWEECGLDRPDKDKL